ncbi:hypothetical protein [Prevotella sp. kh1p2]|uniref:hypothetical protein n=1 Tax=Prevotella sp. kh1p2 TaxID=1761883 RepID=UPI0008BC14A5|nr:hypothetical protein [Prevotella sp. kh1p2]SET20461.1 hypothetical protein SAMN04487825_12016 [Prevotella sp. kh1p2]SNU12267.1 hypothetical protein SAMN06298210_12128 [Prevotellaceae bacterium KH2P17]
MKTISIHKLTLLSLLLGCFASCSSDEEEYQQNPTYDLILSPAKCVFYDKPGYFEAKVMETDADWTHVFITNTPEGENFIPWKPKKMRFQTYQMNQELKKGMSIKFVLKGREFYGEPGDKDVNYSPEEALSIIEPCTPNNQDRSKWSDHPLTGVYTGLVSTFFMPHFYYIMIKTYEGKEFPMIFDANYNIKVDPETIEKTAPDALLKFRILQTKRSEVPDLDNVYYEDAKIQIE